MNNELPKTFLLMQKIISSLVLKKDTAYYHLVKEEVIEYLESFGFTVVELEKVGETNYLTIKDNINRCWIINLNSCFNFTYSKAENNLALFLRTKLSLWKEESMKSCNYQCIITGDKFDDIHHLHSFNLIVKEIQKITGFDMTKSALDFNDSELNKIINVCLDLHNKYPLGVCLCEKIHKLFHNIYGYGNNTPSQFDEFKTRLKSGEFNAYLYDNNLVLSI